jgi:integrase
MRGCHLVPNTKGWSIVYRHPYTEQRRRISLGDIPEQMAVEIEQKLAHLIGAAKWNLAPSQEVLAWFRALPIHIRRRLGDVGLLPGQGWVVLEDIVEAFFRHASIKPATLKHYRQGADALYSYFGRKYLLCKMTAAAACRYRDWLLKECRSRGTAMARLAVARMIWNFGLREEGVESNPFKHVVVPGYRRVVGQKRFVPQEEALAVLAKIRNYCARCVFALARWGGLRIPSEVRELKWADIDWEANTIRVYQPKTERFGKSHRIIPMCPRLREVLADAYQHRMGAAFVVRNVTGAACRIVRAIKAAGVQPWPRLFHSLRSSRQIEFAEHFPPHVVCDWMGNSIPVGERHYLTVLPQHIAAVASGEVEGL